MSNTSYITLAKISKMLDLINIEESLKTAFVDKLNVENACFYYDVLKNNSTKAVEVCALRFVQNWFCMISQNKYHLDLPFQSVKDICLNSGLRITSELEVVSFADGWINHDKSERSIFANDLIKTVRLPLLSYGALHSILRNESSFSNCRDHVKNAARNKRRKTPDPKCVDYQNRYYSRECFHIMVAHDKWVVAENYFYKLQRFDGDSLSETVDLLKTDAPIRSALYSNGMIYLSGNKQYTTFRTIGNREIQIVDHVKTLKTYSVSTKELSKVIEFSKELFYSQLCMFMGNIYVIGDERNQCFVIDQNTKDKSKITSTMKSRRLPGCAVYCGRIVVSGGIHKSGHRHFFEDGTTERSVEAYDHCRDRWVEMPDMIERRYDHASVSIKNKLYMIGGSAATCEVFDSFSGIFVRIKSPATPLYKHGWRSMVNSRHNGLTTLKCVVLGRKIMFFDRDLLKPHVFDVEDEEWSENLNWNPASNIVNENPNFILPVY